VQKIPSSGTATVFHYDKDGMLIAESTPSGNIKTSYIYLNDLPVGVITQNITSALCSVSTPQVNPAATFTPFNSLTRLEVRGGRVPPNATTWAWALGTNTQVTGSFVAGYLGWVSGRVYNFTLSYNGQGAGTYTVSYAGTQLFSKTWSSGLQVGNAIQFYAKTSAGIGAGNYITVNLTNIDGSPVNSTLQTAGDNQLDQATLTYLVPPQASGFTVSGTIAYTYTSSAPTTSNNMDFTVTAGNATCQSTAEALYFISPDHLNTPRFVADNNGNTVWSWASEPFGSMPPNTNPSGQGNFTLNLRFPGQYFDQETGLHYNYYRDYDPSTGRYVQSDPVGLAGGTNTYLYAFASPGLFGDPRGLAIYRGARNYYSDLMPSTGDCERAVFVGGYIVRWESCNPPRPPEAKAPDCPPAQPSTSPTLGGAPGTASGQPSGTLPSTGGADGTNPPPASCMSSCMKDALRAIGLDVAKELAADVAIQRGLQALAARTLITEGMAAAAGSSSLLATGLFASTYFGASAARCSVICR